MKTFELGSVKTVESPKSNETNVFWIFVKYLYFRLHLHFKVISKMIIFGKYKFLLRMSGLDPQGGRKNIVPRIIFLVAFILFNSSVLVLLIFKFQRDINQALNILPILLSSGSLFATYFHLLINRAQFHSFLNEMQDIVQESV